MDGSQKRSYIPKILKFKNQFGGKGAVAFPDLTPPPFPA